MTDLPVPVKVDPVTGHWSVDGQPMVLIPRHFWIFMQVETEKQIGLEGQRAVMWRACYKAARLWCEREAKHHGLSGVEVFRHYLKRLSDRGYGRLTIERIDPAAGTAEIRVDHSIFVAERGRDVGHKVCYMFEGSFAGGLDYAATALGKTLSLKAEEVQCGAEGADHCRFRVWPG